MLRQAKHVYFQDVNHCDNKKFWKIVKRLTKCRSAIPSLQVDDTVTAHTDSEKANLLNNFFTSCFNTLAPPLEQQSNGSTQSLTSCTDDLFCSVEEVTELLRSIDVTKACGPDGITGRMLKLAAYCIAPSVTKFFNLSIKLLYFPHLEKCHDHP